MDEPSGAVTAVLADLGLDDLGLGRETDDEHDINQAGVGRTAPAPSEARA